LPRTGHPADNAAPAASPAAGDPVSGARRALARTLRQAGIADHTFEARILIEDLAGSGDMLDTAAARRLHDALSRRLAGEPLWRILGAREFWGLSFSLSPGTLEPRPDSESLIEAAVQHLGARRQEALNVLDLGTGTGCLLIATLSEFPRARGIGIDLSEDALATATGNAARNGVSDRAEFRLARWDEGLSGRFDLILSNPPYIASSEIALLDTGVREYDPLLALDGGPDGLDAYRALAALLPARLAPAGRAVLEIGAGQEGDVCALMAAAGLRHLQSHRDLGGHARALVFAAEI
jgi:release factor glutamine methyltransferase